MKKDQEKKNKRQGSIGAANQENEVADGGGESIYDGVSGGVSGGGDKYS